MRSALAESFSQETKLSYASNPFTPPAVLEILSMDTSWAVRRKVASNPGASTSVQLILAKDPYPEVRSELALNPNLLPQVAKLLSKDAEPLVRMALAKNGRVPEEVVAPLAHDPLPQVREALATKEPLGRELAKVLLKDPSMTVILRVLRNPTCPVDLVLESLLSLPEETALDFIEVLKPLPIPVQGELARAGGILVKSYLARAPWIDRGVWETLAQDGEPFVREEASKNPVYGRPTTGPR